MSAIALLDANAFYCSVERLFDARLHKRPVIVLSNNDGCVIALTREAKECGIVMGAPYFQIRHLVEAYGVFVYSSNYALYGDLSARLFEVLGQFTSSLEMYSIDEGFFGLEGVPAGELEPYGRHIKAKIEQYLGIPVSLGIARTKTLAKVANRLAKKSGKANNVVNLYDSPYLETALARTAAADVWGIGPAYAAKLTARGIETALQLRDLDDRWVRRNMTVVGLRTVRELRGEPCIPLEFAPRPRKGITVSRTFGKVIEQIEGVQDAVAFYMMRAGEKLRRSHLSAGVLTVFLTTDRFSQGPQYANAATVELARPVNTTAELLAYAREGIRGIFRPGYGYRRAGVMLSDLKPSEQLTLPLYDTDRWERAQRIAATIDEINRRWGRDTVRYGVARTKGEWHTRFGKKSPQYTTDWQELFTVKA